MAIKTLRVFAEYTSTGFVPMPVAGGIDYGYTLANTFPSTQPSTFQTDDPDLDVTVTAMTDFYVWIRISGTAWNPSYTRNVRVYPDSPDINSVVMNMIIATGPAGVSSYSQIVQTANRLYFNGATTDSVYNSKFAGKTYINELNFGTAPQLATVATSGAYADLTGKPALATVATSGSYADLSSKPSGTAPLSYNSGTNSFQITQANSTTNGFLTSTDWNTFNSKYLLPSGGTTAQYLRGDGTLATFPTTLDSTRLILNGRNTTGTTLAKGTVVYINGVSGNTPLFARAIASADSTSAQTLGVVEFDIPNNSNGVVVLVGAVNNLDTSSYTEGVQLYLSGTVAGAFTSSKILAPTHLVYVGIVTRAHPTLGVVEVKIQNGYELDEIHDVQISSPADKHILYYDNATTLWKHSSVTSVLGFTPYNATNPSNYIALTALSASAPLSYNNTTGAFSIAQANGTTNGFLSSTDWTTFNSKQSALTLGNVSEVSSNVLMFPDGGTGKTIGNLTIQVVQSSASTNGYLSSTDWTTFNNKQNALTFGNFTEATSSVLTITGGVGAVIGSGLSVQVKQANTTTSGFLSSTDWNTFNNKASAFSGTTNYIPKFTSSSAIGNSLIYDDATTVFVNTTSGGFNTPRLLINNGGTTSIGFQVNADNGGRVLRFQTSDFNNTNTGSSLRINFGAGSGNTYSVINAYSAGESSTNNLILNQSGGDVAIGTANSSGYKLQVNGSINANSTISVAAWLALKNVSGSILGIGGINSSEYTTLTLHTSGSERMRITSDGKLQVGGNPSIGGINEPGKISLFQNDTKTYSASSNFDTDLFIVRVNGSIVSNQTASLQLVASGNNGTNAGRAIISVVQTNQGLSTGDIVFQNNSNGTIGERMRITSGGNVLIGTTSGGTSVGTGLVVSNTTYLQLRLQSTTQSAGLEWVSSTGYRYEVQASNGGEWFIYNRTTEAYRLMIKDNGNILIGGTTDSGYKLHVTGTIYATSNITANSDLTLKKNLKLIENPAEKLMSLNGYSYQWKENDEYQYGVIAQEVEKVMSYAVQTGNNGIKGVAYNQLTPLLIEGFKLHNQKIDLNTSEITQLKERVKYLEAKLA